MSKLRFCLIGDGAISRYHRKAIEHVGGEVVCVVDPIYDRHAINNTEETRFSHIESLMLLDGKTYGVDVFVICSPSYWHRHQIKYILHNSDAHIICEKPAFMPWEQIIDSDKVNIVLQLLYIKDMPKKADLVKAVFVRDEEYFKTWKGDAKKTGGVFFNLFIHYISLAINFGADFEGIVLSEGQQEHTIWRDEKRIFDIGNVDMQDAYNNMYESILNGNGIKPKDIFYLDWTLRRNSEIFGFGKNSFGKKIKIKNELL